MSRGTVGFCATGSGRLRVADVFIFAGFGTEVDRAQFERAAIVPVIEEADRAAQGVGRMRLQVPAHDPSVVAARARCFRLPAIVARDLDHWCSSLSNQMATPMTGIATRPTLE